MQLSDDQISKANRFWAPKRVVPLISVFTPTFNTEIPLMAAYRSLVEQSYKNWEWVIVDDASGDRSTCEILQTLAKHPQIRVFYGSGEHNVGSLKDQASRLCRGEFLVELDHDDFLFPDALAEIVATFEARPDVDFVYGNSAYFNGDGPLKQYPNNVPQREIQYNGQIWHEVLRNDLAERICDGDGPESLWGWKCPYGPLHPQAFRAKAFWELGGYNPALRFAEDYDLILRFMLRKKWSHINKLLYGYRWDENNASKTHYLEIKEWFRLVRQQHVDEIHAFSRKLQTAREDATTFSDVSAVVIDRTGGMAAVETMEAIAQHMPGAQRILVELNGIESQVGSLAHNRLKHGEDLYGHEAFQFGAKYARNDILFLAAADSPLDSPPTVEVESVRTGEYCMRTLPYGEIMLSGMHKQSQYGVKISVIIPTYKRSEFLSRALDSVFAQDIDPGLVEIRVIGDACPELEKLWPWRGNVVNGFTLICDNLKKNHNDLGATPRNHGILHAKGEYIAYLDDDDRWEPNHLSSLLAAIKDSAWAFSWIISPGIIRQFTGRAFGEIGTSAIMHKRDLIFKYGFWSNDPIKQHFHDWLLVKRWLDAGLEGVCTRLPTLEYNFTSPNPKRADYWKMYNDHLAKEKGTE